MPYRITYCVVFVTIIWSAFAANEDQIREIIQNNMTRNDFSNLLKSLIKLNEQRVSVLQKLYRLEDYGILSEVLRSGKKRTRNGNADNLFLVILSKNQSVPSRRNIDMQVVDSVPALERRPYIVQKPEIRSKDKSEQINNITPTKKPDNFELTLDKNNANKKRFNIDNGNYRFPVSDNDRDERVNYNPKPKEMNIEFKYKKSRLDNVDKDYSSSYSGSAEGEQNVKGKKYGNPNKGKLVSNDGTTNDEDIGEESLEKYDYNQYYPTKDQDKQRNKQQKTVIDVSYENGHNPIYHKIDQHVSHENHSNNKDSSSPIDRSHERNHGNSHSTVFKEYSYGYDHNNKDRTKTIGDLSDENVRGRQITRHDSISHGNERSDNIKYSNIHREKSDEEIHANKRTKNISNGNGHPNRPPYSLKEKSDEDIHDHSNSKKYNPKEKTNENYQNKNYSNIQNKKSNENNHHSKYTRDHSNANDFSNNNSNVTRYNSNESYDLNKHGKIVTDKSKQNSHINKYSNAAGQDSDENGSKYTKILTGNLKSGNDNGNKQSSIGRQRLNDNDHSNKYDNIQKEIKESDDKKHSKITIEIPNEKTSKYKSDEDLKLNEETDNEFDNDDTFSTELYPDDTTQINPGEEKLEEADKEFLKSNPNVDEHKALPESRKNFQKCLNKKALKLCTKSCNTASKNVCGRLKCTSRAKRSLKKECKRSCKKYFSRSKYSSEY